MIGTISIECNAKNPNMPLHPLRAYVNSPSSLRITNVPRKIGKWNINKVTIVAIYPDSTSQTAECVLTGGVWVGTIEGSTTAGTLTQGYTILADGVDENGNDVTGYVLGKGDVVIMKADGVPEPEPATIFVKLQDDGTGAEDGDMYPTESGYVIQQNGEAHQLGTSFEQISAYVDSQVSSKAEISSVPTKTSDLSNDSGFIQQNGMAVIHDLTCDQLVVNQAYIAGYATESDLSSKADLSAVPTKTSQLSNDSGFITTDEVLPYHSALEPTVNTGVANRAYQIAVNDQGNVGNLTDGNFQASYKTERDLTDVFVAGFGITTYWPYVLTQFNGQTYDPSLELKFCNDTLTFMRAGRPRQIYSGWMFRTGGAGFAIPCSEDGTPAGTLYETTAVTVNYVQVSSETPHTIGFTSYGNDPYGHITSLDGQEGAISAYRIGKLRTNSVRETVANISDLPTKTSELSNDSGFIQQNGMAVIHDLTCDQLVANQAYIAGYATESDLSSKAEVSAVHGDYIQDQVGNKIQADGQISAISTYYTVVAFHSDTLGDFTVENDGVWQNELSNAFITAGLAEGMWDVSAVNVDIGGELKNGIGYFSTSDAEVVWTEGDLVGDQSIAVNVERQVHHATIAGTLATQTWVLEQLSALQARIAALEGN